VYDSIVAIGKPVVEIAATDAIVAAKSPETFAAVIVGKVAVAATKVKTPELAVTVIPSAKSVAACDVTKLFADVVKFVVKVAK
jgi:hypothetical protein